MTVLVTGPTGPVGQYVVENLMTGDERVRVLALPETLHRIPFRNRLEIVPGSIEDPEAVREAAQGVRVVYHTAAIAPPPYRTPEDMYRVNVHGTRQLIEAGAGSIDRFVLVSTVVVFTPHRTPDTWPVTERAPRSAHGNPQLRAYGQSMIDAENAVFEAHARHGLEYCILRPTLVCGRNARFVTQLVIALLREPERAMSINNQFGMMQWVHGVDLGNISVVAGRHPAAANETFIVAGQEGVTSFDILVELWSIMNPHAPWNPYQELADQYRVGFNKFDYGKLEQALDYQPTIGVRQCLEEVLGRLEFYTAAGLNIPDRSILAR